MLRLVLSAIALATVIAMAHPAAADPRAATASEHVAVAAPAAEQTAPAAPVWSPSGVSAPTTADRNKDVPVGFGWG